MEYCNYSNKLGGWWLKFKVLGGHYNRTCSLDWGFLGPTKNSTRSSFWLEELVGETLVRHLEFSCAWCSVNGGSIIYVRLRMLILQETNCLLHLVDNFYNWSRVGVLTSSDSLYLFFSSFLICN